MGLFGKVFGNAADNAATTKINDFKGTVMAEGDDNQLFAGCYIVNEFKFVRLVIIGKHDLKSLDGADAFIEHDGGTIEMESDCAEIETERSNTLDKSITSIEFEVDKAQEKAICDASLKSITIKLKKRSYTMAFKDAAKFKEAISDALDLDITVDFEEEEA